MSQHWLGLGKDRSLALAQPPAALSWCWPNFWDGWRTEAWPCVCARALLCVPTEYRGGGNTCTGFWGFGHLEKPGCLPILEWSGTPGQAAPVSIHPPTTRENQKLGQWRDFARHPSPQGHVGEKSGGRGDSSLS